ncbi:MAG: hypothetical protein H0T51_22180, partial [Pirellulales bacterium]|nr:hypothetical protein [Pirellulales bacterium]
MIVSAGGTLQVIDVSTVGYNFADGGGSNSFVTVSGAGSIWSSGTLRVGISTQTFLGFAGGNGSLRVENAGLVNSYGVDLGRDTVSNGSATVTGASSRWNIAGDLDVGVRGAGSLTISDGGTVEQSPFAPGFDVTVSVGGRGTAADGLNGGGTLQVSSGGLLRALNLQVFDTGSVQVDNGSSTVSGLTISGGMAPEAIASPLGPLNIGNTASGRMVVNAGGTVSSSLGTIAAVSGVSGSVLVEGAGSTWNNTGQISVGHNGSGTLEVRNGGRLSSVHGFAGAGTFASGSIIISDPGSAWDASGSFFIGNSGSALLQVLNGGVATTAGNSHLGFTASATGDVIVSGAGSTWNTAVNLNLGGDNAGARGTGSVRIADGGTVNVGAATNLYSTGTIDLWN